MKRRTMIAAIEIAAGISLAAARCGSAGNTTGADTAEESSTSQDSTADGQTASQQEGSSDGTTTDGSGGPGDGQVPDGNGGPGDGQAPDGNGGPGDGQAPDGNGGPGSGQAPDGNGGPGGGADTQTYDYEGDTSGALTVDGEAVTSDQEKTESDTADENAALVKNGGTLTLTGGTLTKSGDDTNGDNCNFYGINSVLLTMGEGSRAYVSGSTLSASSEGSNGLFATDSGVIYASDDTIHTTEGNSRGLDATYGGTILADGMEIHTEGDHSAAAATDRGGGNVSVTNSSLETEGSGSPLLYSTGDIEADNVTGTASGSQIAGMEGYNTILIQNSDLTSTITGRTASDPVANAVIIYQSTSGDADTATGEKALFQAVDSKLTSSIQEGSFFYVTNTTADILLSNTQLSFDSDQAKLLTVEGNDSNNWGKEGENGGTVTFTARDETLEGGISVDTISSLDLYLLYGTTYTGAVSITENEAASEKSAAPVTVNVDSSSTWVVTADSTVSNLNVENGARLVDESGKTVTIVADGKTAVKGTSDITVTVTGTYSTSVSTSEANEISTDTIDRTDFDKYYGTSTTFGENS